MEEEAFEAKIENFANELREAEPGCTVIIFAVRSAGKHPHAPLSVTMKGDDTTANLGLLQVGSDMAKATIYRTFGLSPDGIPLDEVE